MKKRLTKMFAVFLASLLLLGRTQTAGASDYIAANHTAGNGSPYYIMVNRKANTVTVYGLDDGGYYTVPVKAMVCSVGRSGHKTPMGTYSVTGYKQLWLHMKDGSYGQYATQFYGNYLFHSVCYSKADPSTLLTDEYNMLGDPASLGCVRLQTADAKWIYDNCAAGTKVTVYDGDDPGPLGKPDRVVSEITPELDNGWDPTDPREENPWHDRLKESEEPAPIFGVPTNDTLKVDGVTRNPTAYKIWGANYFQLRDIAMLLNGTPAQFSVDYDDALRAVIITTGERYEPNGSELMGATADAEAVLGNDDIYINGEKVDFEVYKIGGASYFQIRVLGQALGFNVGWTKADGMFIESDRAYDPSN